MTKIDAIFFNSLTDSHPKFQPARLAGISVSDIEMWRY